MKNIDDKKIEMKERMKLKLEFSEKVKNNENNKVIKRLKNIKNNELPKIKVINYVKNNEVKGNELYNINITNNDKSYIIYNKIKNGVNKSFKRKIELNKNNKTPEKSSHSLQNMNLISFNENINNIYKKVTINDFNNKVIEHKNIYNMIDNLDNIINTSIINKKIDGIDKNEKNDRKRLKLIKKKTIKNYLENERKNKNVKANKYYSEKISPRKFGNNNTNDVFIEDEPKNKINLNKKMIYKEDVLNKNYYDLENKNKILEINDNKNKNKSEKKNKKNISEDEESSDVTIVSLSSGDIKDISSDFDNF